MSYKHALALYTIYHSAEREIISKHYGCVSNILVDLFIAIYDNLIEFLTPKVHDKITLNKLILYVRPFHNSLPLM